MKPYFVNKRELDTACRVAVAQIARKHAICAPTCYHWKL